MEYPINRGIGKPVEFKGLKSQYLFIFTAGLLILFILFVVMYMAGINQWSCIITGMTLSTILVRTTFYLNKRYGEHGLMKLFAKHNRPCYLINRKKVIHLFPKTKEQ
jgi:hypothetical protein